MFQRRAFEMLNFAFVCLIGYYLYDFLQSDSAPKELKITGLANILSYIYFVMIMVMIYLSTHQTMLMIYNRLKSKQKETAINLRRQNLVMDELERQKRSGNDNDPYTQALQQIVITEALTPSAKRKNLNIDVVDFSAFNRQQMNTASKTSFKKLWKQGSQRMPSVPVQPQMMNDSIYNSSPLLQKKLNPAPPPPINAYKAPTPVAVHTPKTKRKPSLDTKINNNITANPVGNNLQKRIAELTTPKGTRRDLQGYTNPTMTNDEQNLQKIFKSIRK